MPISDPFGPPPSPSTINVTLATAGATYLLGSEDVNATIVSSAAVNLTGNSLNNFLTGNGAANKLDGGLGADILFGGSGNDTYVVDDAGDVVRETGALATEIDSVQTSISYSLADTSNSNQLELVEKLILTGSGNLNGTGNSLANTLTGNSGANVLDGGAGIDTLIGGAGNDTYIVDLKTVGTGAAAGAALQDTVTETGGLINGQDTLQLRGSASNSVASTLTLSADVENLDASATGGAKLNLTGNALANRLTGNAADNLLTGGAGADTLIGGLGSDKLTGGIGNDSFVFNNLVASDTITDFAAGDHLVFDNATFASLGTEGVLDASMFFNGTTANTTQQHIIYNATSGALFYDADGSDAGGLVLIAVLSNHTSLLASDITII